MVFKNFSLDIERGEFLGIKGPSGSGKTTLLSIIGGLEQPDDGEVVFNGNSLYALSSSELAAFRNKNTGFVFQFFNLISYLVAVDNIALPLVIAGSSWRKAREQAILYLNKFGLLDKARKRPHKLSGGEQQRIAIARAIIHNPSIVLADEPTGNLDDDNAEIILNELAKINKEGTTIVLVSHDDKALQYCTRVVSLSCK
ncbi:MAG: ABC transporter ATP-binding protein, partial [Actinomycetota bacterium]|nr:ABC transporter ATP-binding protein [Actinomycetota bacterium]